MRVKAAGRDHFLKAFAAFLLQSGLSPSTVKTYSYTAWKLNRTVNLSRASVQTVLSALPDSSSHYHNTAVRAVSWYWRWRGRGTRLTGARWREPRCLPKPYSEKSRGLYLQGCRDLGWPCWVAAHLGLHGGLRRSEAASLEWTDIDFEREVVRVLGKGHKEREIPASPELLGVLRAWQVECPSRHWVFPSQRCEGHVASGTLLEWHHRALERSGLRVPKRGDNAFHRLRHTAGTEALRVSGNLLAVAAFLGHENVKSTQGYAAIQNEETRRIAGLMYRGGWATPPSPHEERP